MSAILEDNGHKSGGDYSNNLDCLVVANDLSAMSIVSFPSPKVNVKKVVNAVVT